MLTRKIVDRLHTWKATKGRECLLVRGARQVGKTYAVRAFGTEAYPGMVELNFVENPAFKTVFEGPLDAREIKRRITLVDPTADFGRGRTLLFLDEIQECPAARSALKFLAEDDGIDVIASGSLLGISYVEVPSIPVGYERSVTMHGLDFEEFLWAMGYSTAAVGELKRYLAEREAVPDAVNGAMLRRMREFMAVGGMPAVVQRFVDSNSFSEAFEVQQMILASYLDDIATYAKDTEKAKARACYLSLPRQLAKENTKFQYSVVESRGTARKFEGSLDWLRDANLILCCRAVGLPQFPLRAYESNDKFRVYASDPGLLCAMFGFDMAEPLVNDTLAGPMKGGLYENFVADALVKAGRSLNYWVNDKGTQEVEFIVDGPGGSVVPIEVKARRSKSTSFDALLENPGVSLGYKLAAGNVGVAGKKVTLPLYMAPFLWDGDRGTAARK
jgi:hypothetical protein